MKELIKENRFYGLKKIARVLGVLLLIFSFATLVSCDRDDDPSDNDFFAGTYRGTLTFAEGTKTVNTSNGSVFVTKIGSATKYNFRFSDGIPDINGLEFQKEGDNTMTMVGSTGASYIRITNNNLTVLYSHNGKTWTANATR